MATVVFFLFWFVLIGFAICFIYRRYCAVNHQPELNEDQLLRQWFPEPGVALQATAATEWRKALMALAGKAGPAFTGQTLMREIFNVPLSEQNEALIIQLMHLAQDYQPNTIHDLTLDAFCEAMDEKNIRPAQN